MHQISLQPLHTLHVQECTCEFNWKLKGMAGRSTTQHTARTRYERDVHQARVKGRRGHTDRETKRHMDTCLPQVSADLVASRGVASRGVPQDVLQILHAHGHTNIDTRFA